MANSFFDMRRRGITVAVFIIFDRRFLSMNKTTMIPNRLVSQPESPKITCTYLVMEDKVQNLLTDVQTCLENVVSC